jgi:hypothetical protein
MHVTRINWKNDDILPSFPVLGDLSVLHITLDAPPDPVSVTPATVTVVMEVPFTTATGTPPVDGTPPPPIIGSILEGKLAVLPGSIVEWTPTPASLSKINLAFSQPLSFSDGAIVRVTLKGSALWSSQGNSIAYLDGQALGQQGQSSDPRRTSRIDLILPSNSGATASDFESWFRLAPPISLQSLTLDPPIAVVGHFIPPPPIGPFSFPVIGTLTLTAPAPAGGTVVTITSSVPPPVVVLPQPSVVVPPGANKVQFPIIAQTAAFPPGTVTQALLTAQTGLQSVANTLIVQNI